MKLSGSLPPPASLDQRLFGPAPATEIQADVPAPLPPPPKKPEQPATAERRQDLPIVRVNGVPVPEKPPTRPKPPAIPPAVRGSNLDGVPFGDDLDITTRPIQKVSYLFTEEEFEAIEDVKRDLRRTHALDATKNDMVRIAIHELVADYNRNQAKSVVVRELRKLLEK